MHSVVPASKRKMQELSDKMTALGSSNVGPKIPRFVAFSFRASDFWGPSWSLHLVSSQSCSALSWQSLCYGLSRYRSASDRRGGEASKWQPSPSSRPLRLRQRQTP